MPSRMTKLFILAICFSSPTAYAASTGELIQQVQSVQSHGKNHAQAVEAVKQLELIPVAEATQILNAMGDANPLALNWLQGAFESVAARGIKSGELSGNALEEFVTNRDNNARARRLAYEWLLKVDETAAGRLVPTMLDDPSEYLRRDAVALAIETAEQAPQEEQLALWQKALDGAVHEDQVQQISKAMKELGQPVDLIHQFGYLMSWKLIGPFDNIDMKGFDVAYPPESEIDFSAEYQGLKGPVTWKQYVSEDESGLFDIAKLTEPHKGAIDYAYTEFNSPIEQDIEFRLSIKNAFKIWVNGELLFAREEYHRGMRFDQYKVPAHLNKGNNTILLKVCQNEQDESWAQDWSFTFRACNSTGKAVYSVGD